MNTEIDVSSLFYATQAWYFNEETEVVQRIRESLDSERLENLSMIQISDLNFK